MKFMSSAKSVIIAALIFLAVSANQAIAGDKPSQSPKTEIDRLLVEDVFSRDPSCQLAPRANDAVYLRRVYLDIVGEQPTPNEVCAFVLDPAADKRQKVVERLLADPRYGVNWSHYWRDVVMYRRANDQIGNLASSLEPYLVQQFNDNTPWDKLARAFVEAKGDILDNGQGGLYVAQLAEPVDVAAETSRIFLGIQIQCAQCHDHPTDRWKRQQFHEFAAFFPRVALTRSRTGQAGRPSLTLASFDSGPLQRRPGQMGQGGQEHFMPDLKDPTSQGTMMEPVFFATGQRLTKGVTDDERRHSLAEWMTSRDNPWFAKAFVNRMWSELVGEGFYEPIDDMGPDRQCSAPLTMDYLAGQFVEHGHDVKWLLRTIVTTDAYQRESRPRRNDDQLPFTANVAQPLRADQVYDLLVGVTGFNPQGPPQAPVQGPRQPSGPRAQFSALFGYDPSMRRDDISRSIPQALMMMNGNMTERTVDTRQNSSPFAQLLAREKDNEQVAVEVFLRCVAREPNDQELTVCLDHFRNTSSRNEALEDIVWSLLNSKEFVSRR